MGWLRVEADVRSRAPILVKQFPGFFHDDDVEGAAKFPCRDRTPNADGSEHAPCPCKGFIGRDTPLSPDEVPAGDPDAKRDELLDRMMSLPEGSPERAEAEEALRRFGASDAKEGWLSGTSVVDDEAAEEIE